MESDRTAVLLIEAAAEGLIDFRKSRPLDPRWWSHIRPMLEVLDRRKRAAALQAAFDFHRALIANGSLTEKSFEAQQTAAVEVYYDMVGALRPWEGRSYVDRKRKELTDQRQAYIDAFGCDPADPAYKAWEAETIQGLADQFVEKTPDEDLRDRLDKATKEKQERGRRV